MVSLARIKLIEYIEKKKSNNDGWKQGDLAKAVGYSPSYLSELVSGRRVRPSLTFANKLEEVTKVVKASDWSKRG